MAAKSFMTSYKLDKAEVDYWIEQASASCWATIASASINKRAAFTLHVDTLHVGCSKLTVCVLEAGVLQCFQD